MGEATPTYMYGPKDGGLVPEVLWILDEIRLAEVTKAGLFIHKYVLNYDSKNYYYAGCSKPEGNEDE
jgi:hypothetical protein